MSKIVAIFLHLDKYLSSVADQYGIFTYIFLFLIVFLETGIVVTPFLPGDSLLFAAGALAASGTLSIWTLFVLFLVAAIIGDTVNYAIGDKLGKTIIARGTFLGLKVRKAHLERANEFYKKYGSKAIVVARFVPVLRTVAPFMAGVGVMTYRTFIIYNVIGALAWTSIFTFGGYFFGNIPAVKERFSLIIVAIVVISIAPLVREYLITRRKKE